MKKLTSVICAAFILLISAVCMPTVHAFTPTAFDVSSECAMLVNMDTGEKIYKKNETERISPASTTKLMTAYVVYQNVSDMNTVITVKGDLIDTLLGTDSSLAYIKDGEELTVDDLLHYLLITSGNDASLVLADYIGGGSVETFVQMMNNTAEELGMNNTHFENPHGLTDDEHYTTVEDMYLLSSEVFNTPYLSDIVSKARYSIGATNKNPKRIMVNTNFLIDPTTDYYYSAVIGGKTGYTDAAGRCIISFAEKDNMRYLCLVMKGDPEAETRVEFTDSINLYKWAFSTFEYKTVVSENEPIDGIQVDLSWSVDYIQLYSKTGVTALLPKEANSSTLTFDVNLIGDKIDAPIESGQKLGTAKVYYAGEQIGQIDLVAGETVERSLILYMWKLIRELFSSIWMKLILAAIGLAIIILVIITIVQNRNRRNRKRVRIHKRI